ncbi:MAG: hypothetical protein MZV65_19190 [Chromatiales bacterium]|nr:hypothetical protein [Chromatiales bacterium]
MTAPRVRHSYYEANARQRLAGLLDAGSFRELLGPGERVTSPHLPELGLPVAFDDGVVVGHGRLAERAVLVAAPGGRVSRRRGRRGTRRQDHRPAGARRRRGGRRRCCYCWNPGACACTRPMPG